jgi:hypothetical protein
MNDHEHQRRIEGWLRVGVAIIVPVTVVVGLWLLLSKHRETAAPQPTDGSAHVMAFPAQPGPPAVTLAPPASQSRSTTSTP